MAIRLRVINGTLVALCAARSVEKLGDVYIDDAQHYALAGKFAQDWNSQLSEKPLSEHPDENQLRDVEESNNVNRTDWDKTFGLEMVN